LKLSIFLDQLFQSDAGKIYYQPDSVAGAFTLHYFTNTIFSMPHARPRGKSAPRLTFRAERLRTSNLRRLILWRADTALFEKLHNAVNRIVRFAGIVADLFHSCCIRVGRSQFICFSFMAQPA